jgi:anti-sigma factor RsiW
MEHLTTDLIADLTGELAPTERERVEAHLAACADCRAQREILQTLLDRLRASAPAPPEIHWGRWRADLRARLEGRTARHRRWMRPVALAAGLAAGLLAVVWLGGDRGAPRTDLAGVEEVVRGDNLEFFRQSSLIERPDFLEDLDVIDHLDRLAPRAEG